MTTTARFAVSTPDDEIIGYVYADENSAEYVVRHGSPVVESDLWWSEFDHYTFGPFATATKAIRSVERLSRGLSVADLYVTDADLRSAR